MAKLIQSKEPFQYAIENMRDDGDWGFLFSYAIEPISMDEYEWSKSFPNIQLSRAEQLSKIGESKLDPIDRFQK
jgi:hypothetical protein